MKKKKKNKILIFLNVWAAEFLQIVLEDIKKCAEKDGVDLFVFTSTVFSTDSSSSSGCQLNLFRLPNPEDFDGAIIFSNTFNFTAEEDRVRELLHNSGIPVVSTEVKLDGMSFVGTDNYKGEYELMNHLMKEHRCKDIVYVSGIEGNKENAIRKQAVIDALSEHNLVLKDVIQGYFGFYDSKMSVLEWIKENKLPDAFVCANDFSAMGTAAAVFESGYSVPEDVLVAGYDYSIDGRTFDPMIASVKRSWENMGEIAYRELYKQVNEGTPCTEIYLPTEFVPSESCGCKPSSKDLQFKKEANRNKYINGIDVDMLDYYFKNLRIASSTVKKKEEINAAVSDEFKNWKYMGDDFWICTEPAYFEIPNKEYASKITRISRTLDVLFSMEGGKVKKATTFNSETLVPGYKKKPGESNVYIFIPLNNLDHIIGYAVTKNNTKILYKSMIYLWTINMDGIFSHMRDIIFAEKTNERLRVISMTDQLTGMYNRVGLSDEISKFINSNRKKNKISTLLFADIDSMKFINDYFGHLKGDMAIKATADALKYNLDGEWQFARFGGDEFVIVGNTPEGVDLEKFKKQLNENIKNYIEDLELGFPLSISIGCSQIYPKERFRMEDYIKLADDSMYQEKEEAHQRIKNEMKKYKKQIL